MYATLIASARSRRNSSSAASNSSIRVEPAKRLCPQATMRVDMTNFPELNPQETLRDKFAKNLQDALKSMDEVYAKLEDAAPYIERDPALVKSITSFS
jgi:hypothetical protein